MGYGADVVVLVIHPGIAWPRCFEKVGPTQDGLTLNVIRGIPIIRRCRDYCLDCIRIVGHIAKLCDGVAERRQAACGNLTYDGFRPGCGKISRQAGRLPGRVGGLASSNPFIWIQAGQSGKGKTPALARYSGRFRPESRASAGVLAEGFGPNADRPRDGYPMQRAARPARFTILHFRFKPLPHRQRNCVKKESPCKPAC